MPDPTVDPRAPLDPAVIQFTALAHNSAAVRALDLSNRGDQLVSVRFGATGGPAFNLTGHLEAVRHLVDQASDQLAHLATEMNS